MKLNAFDNFLVEDVLPDIKNALKKEEAIFRKRITNSSEAKFYESDLKSLVSNLFTERTIQYIIFRELCISYKMIVEESSYSKTKERLDLVFYKIILTGKIYMVKLVLS